MNMKGIFVCDYDFFLFEWVIEILILRENGDGRY